MIKAIIFDLWETIADDDGKYSYIIDNELGLDGKEFLKGFWHLGTARWHIDKKGTPIRYFSEICEIYQLDKNKSLPVLKKIWKESLREGSGYVYDWTIPMLRKLKDNYELALLSNTGIDGASFIEENKSLKKLFDIIVLSYKVGCAKPDKKIYSICLNKLGLAPDQCLFIDNKKENVIAAKKIGINSILYTDYRHLKKDLIKLKIKF